jgi:hypothetical protein
VAVSGELVIVGAPNETADGQANAGHAYVFNLESGALVSTLTSPNPQQSGIFGWSVAANGTYALIGAPGEAAYKIPGAGEAYLFNITSGLLMRTVSSPDAQINGHFGESVAASTNLIVVGAYYETAHGDNRAGNAYVSLLRTGASVANLTSPDYSSDGWFGKSVALTNSFIVVGAPHEYANGLTFAGHAYVFNANTGELNLSLSSRNPQPYGSFGFSVAANAANLIVGAPFESADGLNSAGNVYTFKLVNGSFQGGFHSPNPTSGGDFGWSVAADSNSFVVGATNDNPSSSANNAPESGWGESYVFDIANMSLRSALTAPGDHTLQIGFGWSVAIESETVVVGSPTMTNAGAPGSGGIAYVF